MAPLRDKPFSEDPAQRRQRGQYYTPVPIVLAAYRLLADALREAGLAQERCALIDPACGTGAFLARPEARAFRSSHGLDLDPQALARARCAAPWADLVLGDAYGEGLTALSARIRSNGPVAVIGNPPYRGSSLLLKSDRYLAVREQLAPYARNVAKGASIRDDYALFFGVADLLVEAGGGEGAIAFVTSASFIDNFLYAPLRGWLLERYRLHALVELGPRLFEGTRVATALSVWVRSPRPHQATFGHLRLQGSAQERLAQLSGELNLEGARPQGRALLLNAPSPEQVRVLQAMGEAGPRIGLIFPVSFPGLKTRFDELLTDDDREVLIGRMRDFFASEDVDDFALRHRIPDRTRAKLEAAFAARARTAFGENAVRPFARFAGAPHRFRVPEAAMAWTYLEPALIPRGDHRFRGPYDPHRGGPKLVFNVREFPLSAAVVDGDACVHDYRHSRFAPLWAPEGIVRQGLGAARKADLDRRVLNLSPAWCRAAELLADPSELLFYVCGVINSRVVQEQFAPVLGASEEVPIPRLDETRLALAHEIARAARMVEPGGWLPDSAEQQVRELFGV
jgi:hypothetical protein